MSTVYVVSFAPADDQGGVGGFDWTLDPVRADRLYVEAVRESAREVREGRAGHVVRLVPLFAVRPCTSSEITDAIERGLDRIESCSPARRQYVPPTTIPEYVPTGGISRHTFPEEIQP